MAWVRATKTLPHEVLVCEHSGVLSQGLVWLLPHLLKLIVPHALKQSLHVLLAALQLRPLYMCVCVCVRVCE